MAAPSESMNFNIGVLGHIDSGKTTLGESTNSFTIGRNIVLDQRYIVSLVHGVIRD
jgi:translation elongation factor EF-Tu-like GTPase